MASGAIFQDSGIIYPEKNGISLPVFRIAGRGIPLASSFRATKPAPHERRASGNPDPAPATPRNQAGAQAVFEEDQITDKRLLNR